MVNLSDLDLQIGFVVLQKKSWKPLPEGLLDENYLIKRPGNSKLSEHAPLVSCKDLFEDVDDLSERQLEMIELGGCLDPQHTAVKGTKVYSDD